MGLGHFIRRKQSERREAKKAAERPAAVTHAQRAHVLANPSCAGCGTLKHVQGHHIVDYHDDPSKGADPANFISLCMDVEECHFREGHRYDFRKPSNPNVVRDAALSLANPSARPALWARLKAEAASVQET